VIFIVSLFWPALAAAVAVTSDVTIEGIIEAAVLLYVIQVAIALFIARTRMPREMKADWHYRRIKKARRPRAAEHPSDTP
jgi:lysylphosphatidylglycerol synthetase-like protein (DUF2156 family)